MERSGTTFEGRMRVESRIGEGGGISCERREEEMQGLRFSINGIILYAQYVCIYVGIYVI